MISSAVVIPEQESEQRSTPPSLKRRQSSVSLDTSKKPRLDTQVSNENGAQPNSAGAMSPQNRRRSAIGTGAAEEKKRGQRLFGALLGTLSQTSSKPVHRKRDEIEQRQRERVRKDNEEKEEERRRKREELDRARLVEQKAWDKESMRIRHRNTRAMAGFLQTKTEPKLYYKPWELREGEEERIRRQIKEVEERIRIEVGNLSSDDIRPDQDDEMQDPLDKKRDSGPEDTEQHIEMVQEVMDTGDQMSRDVSNSPVGDKKAIEGKGTGEESNGHNKIEDDRPKDDDHAGEELVEGQEDDVIY